MIPFSKAKFLISCLEAKDFPSLYAKRGVLCPEIAFVGRSNACKSSLINHLTEKKDLVFVSSTPGKTQLLNFFALENRLMLVDLPGYGFAKIPKELKKTWGQRLSNYLENRPQLALLIFVLDLRRTLSEEDKQMISWASFHQKKMLFVLSKSDKLSSSEKKLAEEALATSIASHLKDKPTFLSYSIKEPSCRTALRQLITSLLGSHGTTQN